MKRKRRAFNPPVPGRNRRAARALWQACSRRQRAQLRRSRAFTVRGSVGGRYKIVFAPYDAWYGSQRVLVDQLSIRKGWGRTRYAWHGPLADAALAFKLWLEASETSFKKIQGCNALTVCW